MSFSNIRQSWYSRLISSCLVVTFVVTMVITPKASYAQVGVLGLPQPGTMVNLSTPYMPLMLAGLTVHPENPLLMDFIVRTGNSRMNTLQVKKASDRLIKYFLACLTIPESNQWVNLSPYENDRIIPQDLGQTVLGQDMLEQDYILKQLTASLIYPEKNLGKNFWDKVYAKANEMYGTTKIPVNTFNKVWILPQFAKVYVHNNTVLVVKSHLRVMLDVDYLSLSRHTNNPDIRSEANGLNRNNSSTINNLGNQIVRSIILPAIEQEVNTGKNFAQLRQIYNSMILAVWFKNNLKQALLNQVYSDKSKVNGVNVDDPAIKEKIYRQYLEAYKKGVFNYIKEENDPNTNETIPRKYFSGGIRTINEAMLHFVPVEEEVASLRGRQQGDEFLLVKGRTTSEAMTVPQAKEAITIAFKLSGATAEYARPFETIKGGLDTAEHLRGYLTVILGELRAKQAKSGEVLREEYQRVIKPLEDVSYELGKTINPAPIKLMTVPEAQDAIEVALDSFVETQNIAQRFRGSRNGENSVRDLQQYLILLLTHLREILPTKGPASQEEYQRVIGLLQDVSYQLGKTKPVVSHAAISGQPSADLVTILSQKVLSVRQHIQPLLDAYYAAKAAGAADEAKRLDVAINKIVDQLNAYTQSNPEDLILSDDIEPLSRFLTSPDIEEYRRLAKQALLDGNYIPQFIFAGAATRLNRGPMYNLDIWDIAIELGKATVADPKSRMGMGPRQIMAYRLALEDLARQNGVTFGDVIARQKIIVNINGDIDQTVLDDFIKNKFYGFNPANVYFITQPTFHGYKYQDNDLVFDPKSPTVPYGHGHNFMQLGENGQAFTLGEDGSRNYIESGLLNLFPDTDIIGSHRINDLTKLSKDSVISIDKLAYAIAQIKQGFDVVVELVENPNKQKGGNALKNKRTGKSFLLETSNAKGSSELTNLVDEAGKIGAPYNAFRLEDSVGSLKRILNKKLPFNLRFKDGFFYLEAVTGDVTQMPETNAKFMSSGEQIHDFKEPKNVDDALNYLRQSDNQLIGSNSGTSSHAMLVLPSSTQLVRLAAVSKESIQRTLDGYPSSGLSRLPSYLQAATGHESGYFIGLDWGGTNVRVALVHLVPGQDPKIVSEQKAEFPQDYVIGNKTKEEVFGFIADKIDQLLSNLPGGLGLGANEKINLGFVFSFPIRQNASAKSAVLLKMNKGWKIPGITEEEMHGNAPDVVQVLQNAINVRPNLSGRVNVHAILNDTVATQLSAAGLLGIILGTGHNISIKNPKTGEMINLEFGAFNGIAAELRTLFDEELLRNADPRNGQMFEKMVSGLYLIQLLRKEVESSLANHQGLRKLFELHKVDSEVLSLAADQNLPVEKMNARLTASYGQEVNLTSAEKQILSVPSQTLLIRTGMLLGAVVAASLDVIDPKRQLQAPVVGIDGSVYNYNPIVQEAVIKTVRDITGRTVQFKSIPNATVIGAAVAAAVGANVSHAMLVAHNHTVSIDVPEGPGIQVDMQIAAAEGAKEDHDSIILRRGPDGVEFYRLSKGTVRNVSIMSERYGFGKDPKGSLREITVLLTTNPKDPNIVDLTNSSINKISKAGREITLETSAVPAPVAVSEETSETLNALAAAAAATTKAGKKNAAMAHDYGGISLNSKNLNLESSGEKVNITFDPAMIAQFKRGDFSGVRIQILDVVPISIMPMLGLKEEEGVGQLARA